MTTFLSPSSRRLTASLSPARQAFFALIFGGAIGVLAGLATYVLKFTYVALLPAGLALIISAILFKNYRLYWFTLFLFSLQFTISKNLNDGIAVVDALKIDYTIQNFTFQITASDVILLIMLAIWANDRMFHRKPLRFPAVTWFAVAYLCICFISTLGASSTYLGLVELWQQIKYFIVYLLAVNWLDSKSAVRVLVLTGVLMLAIQGGVTIGRFYTGNLTPFTFGETYQDTSQIEHYLAVDRSDGGSAIRAFGTLGSPGATARLCLMLIPFGLFLSVPNAMFGLRFVFAALTALGIGGLVLTFARVYFITTAFQTALAFLIVLRDRMLKREEVILIVMLGIAGLAAISPKLYEQFSVREDSASVRFLQYEATAKMIRDHPLLGVGLNNGTREKQKYVEVTYNQFDPNTQFGDEPTHNLYLSLASEIGVLGALLFVTFFGRITFLTWRQSRLSPDPEIRLTANALVVVFCGVAVNSMMDPLQEYHVLVLLWLYAGISLALPAMAEPQESVPSEQKRQGGKPAKVGGRPGRLLA